MEDKEFIRKVRLKLLKEGRIREIFQVNKNGYGFGKIEDGKYTLGVSAKNKEREVKLELDENDKDLGYRIMKMKHNAGVYPKSKDNKYLVSSLETEYGEDSMLKVSIAKVSGELHSGDFDYVLRNNPKYKILREVVGNALYYREMVQFKDEEDYEEFCRQGYRIIEEDLKDFDKIIGKYITDRTLEKDQLEEEIKEANKLKEEYLKEGLIESERPKGGLTL